MRNPMLLLVIGAAALLGACDKGATVEGQGGRKLTLTKPGDVTIHRADMAKVDVKIKRENLPGDVTVKFSNLPRGVDVVDEDMRIVGDQGTYTLRASETADLVEKHAAQVTTSAPGGVAVTETINVNVKEKKEGTKQNQ